MHGHTGYSHTAREAHENAAVGGQYRERLIDRLCLLQSASKTFEPSAHHDARAPTADTLMCRGHSGAARPVADTEWWLSSGEKGYCRRSAPVADCFGLGYPLRSGKVNEVHLHNIDPLRQHTMHHYTDARTHARKHAHRAGRTLPRARTPVFLLRVVTCAVEVTGHRTRPRPIPFMPRDSSPAARLRPL